MASGIRNLLLCVLMLYALHSRGDGEADSLKVTKLSSWAFESLNIPKLNLALKEQIVVAVIDDGFMLSHNSLKGFIYINENDIPGNNIDDDQNGYIDDYQGWDIADNDNDVSINKGLVSSHYHGTFIASLISRIVTDCLGANGEEQIRILPIKVLSDNAQSTAIKEGYDGIKYAIKMKADIICTAWSGGIPDSDEKSYINLALQNNILLIGSAGNTNQEMVDHPASATGVYAIAAVDSLKRKTSDSNYGMKIDLALPGEHVRAAYPDAQNAYFYGRGTSAAAGLATGCAAVLKGLKPSSNPWEIIEALKNTSIPIDSINSSYCGKLGSGLPDLKSAIKYLLAPESRPSFFNSRRPEGTIYVSKKNERKEWKINPWGAYKSIMIIPENINRKDASKTINIRAVNNTIYTGKLEDLKETVIVPGNSATVTFPSGGRRPLPTEMKLNYYAETIDSTTLYCGETIKILDQQGTISDNSGNENYANNCSCRWKIQLPGHQQIEFTFTEFDTEAKVDFVWLFDGDSTNPENIIGKFSGSDLPPDITSRTNFVTVWFVTDSERTGKGWKLEYRGK